MRNITIRRVFIASVVLVFAIGLQGCGGGGATTETEISTQTLGQELIDLKKAYDSGVITKREYEKARERLIKRR
jgi:hypothetical protein